MFSKAATLRAAHSRSASLCRRSVFQEKPKCQTKSRNLNTCASIIRNHGALTRPVAAAPMCRRHLATAPPQMAEASPWQGEKHYDAVAEGTMETMQESLENLLDEYGNPEYEVEYSSGVLTLRLGPHGTYVINKQPPNRQIWLSSPKSGPKRYDYVRKDESGHEDDWVYARDHRSLGELLNEELSEIFGQDVDVGIRNVSELA